MKFIFKAIGFLVVTIFTCGFALVFMPLLLLLSLFFKGIKVRTSGRSVFDDRYRPAAPDWRGEVSAEEDVIDVTAQSLDRKEIIAAADRDSAKHN